MSRRMIGGGRVDSPPAVVVAVVVVVGKKERKRKKEKVKEKEKEKAVAAVAAIKVESTWMVASSRTMVCSTSVLAVLRDTV